MAWEATECHQSRQKSNSRVLHVYILPSSVQAWTDNCCLSVLSPFDCEYSSGCYCVKWVNPTEITSLRPTQRPTYWDQQKWATWGPQTISSSQVRVALLPIVTSENNNRHTYSHTQALTHTYLVSTCLWICIPVLCRPPERSLPLHVSPPWYRYRDSSYICRRKLLGSFIVHKNV